MNQKATLIVGATSGIGLATAKLLSKDRIIIGLGRNLSSLRELQTHNAQVYALGVDLLNSSAPTKIRKFVNENHFLINTIIHSAGIGLSQSFSSYEATAVDKLFKTNVHSAFAIISEFLPDMLSANGGNVCLVSSTAGIYGYKYNGAYCATKHALIGMVKSLAKEHGKRGIVATAVCPGLVDTPMTDRTISGLMKHHGLTREQAIAKLSAISPQNRIMPAEEVAEAIAFACSGRVPSLSGSSLNLGGGE